MKITFDQWVARQARESGIPASVVEYRIGVPVNEIAVRYGITPKTVRKRARVFGEGPRKVKIDGPWAQGIIAMYRRGAPWKTICRAWEIDSTTLSEVLKRGGVKLRTQKI